MGTLTVVTTTTQAGRHVEVSEMGKWWASVDRADWPKGHVDSILEDFDGEGGDRRQVASKGSSAACK